MTEQFEQFLEKVKEAHPIEKVIGSRVQLHKHNKVRCPFHNDKTPSLSVNIKEQYFKCFGCDVGGDVIRFLELYENKKFNEVVLELANQAGIPLPNQASDEDRSKIQETRIIKNILTATAQYYHHNLTPEVKDYLIKERGLSEQTIAQFMIGFAQGGLYMHLVKEKDFSLELCIKSKVLKQTTENDVKDYFYGRIIFPNLRRGEVIHMTGRCFGAHEPKYLHLSGEIQNLFNEEALQHDEVFIAEGAIDCATLNQYELPSVGILGTTHFKSEYVSKFEYCKKVYVCMDGDGAGQKAAVIIGELLGEKAKIIQMPEGTDINEYFKKYSKDDFLGLVKQACTLTSYQLKDIEAFTPKTELLQKLDPVLRRLAKENQVIQEAYLNHDIKERFKLGAHEIDAYRKLISKYAPENKKDDIKTDKNDEPSFRASFDGLVDIGEENGKPVFIVKKDDWISIVSQFESGDRIFVPPPKDQIPWLLPRAVEVLKYYRDFKNMPLNESSVNLFDDISKYFRSISELPSDAYYDLLTAWVIHTYLLENFQYSPIICLFAVPERGKSRTGKGLIYTAYRGIHVESLRDPYLVRVSEDLNVSIFFDVRDIWRKAERNESEDILLHRFEKGIKVPRVLYPDRGAHKDIKYFNIFGPTIIGTNEGIHNILETRAVLINMPETSRRFENSVIPKDALPYKERLIAFRAIHYGNALPDVSKPASGRLGDILKPLNQIIRMMKPDREQAFLQLVNELERGRLIEKSESIEAQILTMLIKNRHLVQRGVLPVKIITDDLNNGRPERQHFTYQKIGRKLQSMGFKKERMGDGASAILWDEAMTCPY